MPGSSLVGKNVILEWFVKNSSEIKNLLIVLFAFNRHFNPTGSHIRFFSKKSLFGLLQKYGFKVLKYGYYGRFYPVSHSIYILAEKK